MAKKCNYVNEVELKSVLIRVKNAALLFAKPVPKRKKEQKKSVNTASIENFVGVVKPEPQVQEVKVLTKPDIDVSKSPRRNVRIAELVAMYKKLDSKTSSYVRLNKFKHKIRDHIVWMSERTVADDRVKNRLGEISMMMVKRILSKPQFSGYTYYDEFYSDATYKIFRYITNFDHTKISKISGQAVNAFAYVTQIIHNSIIYVISSHKRETDNVTKDIYRHLILANSINHISFMNSPEETGTAKVKINKYYYTTNDFFTNFSEYLKNLDFDKIDTLTVTCPKGCLTKNYTQNNIVFKYF